MGKWTKLVKDLPRLPIEDEEDPDRQAKINAAVGEFVREHGQPTTDSLAREYLKRRTIKDKLKAELKLKNFDVQVIETLILGTFEEAEVSSLKFECNLTECYCKGSGHNVITIPEPYGQIDREKNGKEVYRQWCIKQGLQKEMHLHPSKTQSLVKERLEAGRPTPPGLKLFNRTNVQLRKQ